MISSPYTSGGAAETGGIIVCVDVTPSSARDERPNRRSKKLVDGLLGIPVDPQVRID